METLNSSYGAQIKKAMSLAKVATVITPENVYQEGDERIIPILEGEMLAPLLLPGSRVENMENFEELYSRSLENKSCLLLVEHYSNMDLSIVSYMLRQAGGRGEKISKGLVAIAGMKLNEDNPVVAAFASAYTRVVIYPNRSLHGLDDEIKKIEVPRSQRINHSAMKAMKDVKMKGKIVLLFPSGTRYRSWDPSTKDVIREIDSYIRSFDYMCCVALNGEVLHVQQTDMMNDAISKDVVWVTAGPVRSCSEFRAQAKIAGEAQGIDDKKIATANAIKEELDALHSAAEEKRQKYLNE